MYFFLYYIRHQLQEKNEELDVASCVRFYIRILSSLSHALYFQYLLYLVNELLVYDKIVNKILLKCSRN